MMTEIDIQREVQGRLRDRNEVSAKFLDWADEFGELFIACTKQSESVAITKCRVGQLVYDHLKNKIENDVRGEQS